MTALYIVFIDNTTLPKIIKLTVSARSNKSYNALRIEMWSYSRLVYFPQNMNSICMEQIFKLLVYAAFDKTSLIILRLFNFVAQFISKLDTSLSPTRGPGAYPGKRIYACAYTCSEKR